MFLKSIPNSNKDFSVLVDYINKGLEQDSDFGCFHNLSGISREEVIEEFTQNDLGRKKVKSAAMHEIMSFSPKDGNIPDEVLLDLCQYYIQRRCPSGLAFGRVHRGTNCTHVHLMLSSTTLEEKERSTSIRKWEFLKLHRELEQRQIEKHDLVHSVVFDKSKRKKKELSLHQTNKRFLLDTAAQCAEKALGFKDFLRLMEQYDGIAVYSRKHAKNFGVHFKNKNWRFATILAPEKLELLKELDKLQLLREAAQQEQEQEMEY